MCPPGQRRIVISDSQVLGLTLEVRASGGKTFYVRYNDTHGAQRNLKVGDPSSVTLEAARQRAVAVRSSVATGEDPVADKRKARAVPTLKRFAEAQYLPFVSGYKKSWACDESLLRLHILPVFGGRRLDSIKWADVTELHHGLRARGYATGTCNRILVLLRYMFNLALKWQVDGVADNPTQHVDLFKVDNKRQRFLSREEVNRLFSALGQSQNPTLRDIVGFLLITGARKQEAQRARWKDFDVDRGFWLIPNTKSGKPRPVPISGLLSELMANLPSNGRSPFLFPNPDTGKPYVSIYHTWNVARKQAGLADVRIHDLRHSFASFLINSGRSLYEVQKLLGHAHITTTERYAHLANETLMDAVNTVESFVNLSPR